MKSSDILSDIWASLKIEKDEYGGYYERRIYASSKYSLFAGIYKPSNLVNFSLICSTKQALKIQDQTLKGFKIIKESLTDDQTRIRVELTQAAYQDIFQWVASDILDKLIEYNNENEAAVILEKRVEHWKKFIQASGPDGLSKNQQIGLFGELLILNSQLNFTSNRNSILDAWLGPDASNHDFVLGKNAIEVKTTTGNEHTRVHISNEYQLDSTGFERLFLCHVRLDERQGSGTSLPVLIDEIMELLPDILKISFIESLAILGYVDKQRGFYEASGYFERARSYYLVTEGFPKITRETLASGVNQVSYQIDLSCAVQNKKTEQQVLQAYFDTKS